MIRITLPLLLVVSLLVGLLPAQETPVQKKNRDPEKAAKKWLDENAWPLDYDDANTWADYGEHLALAKDATVSLKELAEKPGDYKDRKIRIEGRITAICAKAGCWLTLSDGENELFVKFKDYGFFVPRHLAGHDAVLEGLAEKIVFTEAQRKHMAEDAGKSEAEIAAITGDEVRLKMMADAVRIRIPAVIDLGTLDPKAKKVALGELGTEPALVKGTLVKAEKDRVEIEAEGKRLVIALPEPGLDADQLARLKAAEKPVKVKACGSLTGEGEARHLKASGVALHVGRR